MKKEIFMDHPRSKNAQLNFRGVYGVCGGSPWPVFCAVNEKLPPCPTGSKCTRKS